MMAHIARIWSLELDTHMIPVDDLSILGLPREQKNPKESFRWWDFDSPNFKMDS